jgi:hypothetical protein
MVTTYEDFVSFARAVRTHQEAHPDWLRLNGQEKGGDQNPWAYFVHIDRTWKVDADTHFRPIIAAHEYYLRTGNDPFRMDSTPSRRSLIVVDALRDELISQDPKYRDNKYLYIYEK